MEKAEKSGTLVLDFNDVRVTRCDALSECDSYIKVLVNGDEKTSFRTYTHTEEPEPLVTDVFLSDKVPIDAKVTVEMWDEDVLEDDLLLSKTFNIDEFTKDDKEKHEGEFVMKNEDSQVKVQGFWKVNTLPVD